MKALFHRIRRLLRFKKFRRTWMRAISVIACITVFVTTYALVLPAITMESEAPCGIQAHQHDDSCYEYRMVCGKTGEDGHVHDNHCYKKVLVCGLEAHVHGEDCYLQQQQGPASDYSGAADPAGASMAGGDTSMEEVLVEDALEEEVTSGLGEEAKPVAEKDGTSEAESPQEDSGQSVDAENRVESAGTEETAGGASGDGDGQQGDAAAKGSSGNVQNEDGEAVVSEEFDLSAFLDGDTGIYYHSVGEGEMIEDSSLISDWKKVNEDTVLGKNDLIRVYLSYSIPAGTLDAAKNTACYRLPGNLHLTDAQILSINRFENGIAAKYMDTDGSTVLDSQKYHRFLGAEAVEGDRTPDLEAPEAGEEYLSATVKARDIYDSDSAHGVDSVSGLDDLEGHVGQELSFLFTDRTILINSSKAETGASAQSGSTAAGTRTGNEAGDSTSETARKDSENTGAGAAENTSENTGAGAAENTSENTGAGAAENTSENTGAGTAESTPENTGAGTEEGTPENAGENAPTAAGESVSAPEASADSQESGSEVRGWFTLDFNMEQVDWDASDAGSGLTGTAQIVFVPEDRAAKVREVSCRLALAGTDTEDAGEKEKTRVAKKSRGAVRKEEPEPSQEEEESLEAFEEFDEEVGGSLYMSAAEEQTVRTVKINLYDYDGTTSLGANADNGLQGKSYGVLMVLSDHQNNPVAYSVRGVDFNSGNEASCSFNNTFKALKNESWGIVDASGETVAYDPSVHQWSVRLYEDSCSADQWVYKDYYNITHLWDSMTGFEFLASPNGNVTNGNSTVLNLKRAYNKEYCVRLEIDPAGLTVTEEDQYYLLLTSEHATTGTTYAWHRLQISPEDSILDIPVKWYDANQNLKENERFTGNEQISVEIYTTKTDGDGKKRSFSNLNDFRQNQEKIPVVNGDSINRYDVHLNAGREREDDEINQVTKIYDRIILTAPSGTISKGYLDGMLDDATDFGYYTEKYEGHNTDAEATIAAAVLSGKFNNQGFGYSSSNVNVNRLKVLKVFTGADGSPKAGRQVTIRLRRADNGSQVGEKTGTTNSQGYFEVEFEGLSPGEYRISELIGGTEVSESGVISVNGETISSNFSTTSVKFAENANVNYFGKIEYEDDASCYDMIQAGSRVPMVILTDSQDEVDRLNRVKDSLSGRTITVFQNGTNGYKNYDIPADMVKLRGLSDELAAAASSSTLRVINLKASEMPLNGLNLDDDGRYIILNITMDQDQFCPLVILDGQSLDADYGQSGNGNSSKVLYNLRSTAGGLYTGNVTTSKDGAGVILAPSANVIGLKANFGGTIISERVTHNWSELHSNNPNQIQTLNAVITNVSGAAGTGSLELRKDFSDPGIKDRTTFFTFEVSLSNTDPGKVKGKSFPASGLEEGNFVSFDGEGKARIRVRARNSVTISSLPEGTAYTVTELRTPETEHFRLDYYEKTAGGITSHSNTGMISQNGTDTVKVVNKTDGGAGVSFDGRKILKGGTLEAEAYDFLLEEYTDASFAQKTADFEVQTKKNDAAGSVCFDRILYTQAGDHYYLIGEVLPQDAVSTDGGAEKLLPDGRILRYDLTEYRYHVHVRDSGDGSLSADVFRIRDGQESGEQGAAEADGEQSSGTDGAQGSADSGGGQSQQGSGGSDSTQDSAGTEEAVYTDEAFSFTNWIEEKTSVEASKMWAEGINSSAYAVELRLRRSVDGKEDTSFELKDAVRVLGVSEDPETVWKAKWTDLPVIGKDQKGNVVEYSYYVTEEKVYRKDDKDKKDVSSKFLSVRSADGLLITNYPALTGIEVEKKWENGTEAPEGAKVTVKLYRRRREIILHGSSVSDPSWEEYSSVSTDSGIKETDLLLTGENDWKGKFEKLPAFEYDSNERNLYEYEYSAMEVRVTDKDGKDITQEYTSVTQTGQDWKVTISNSKTEKISFTVTKDWKDADGNDLLSGHSITFSVKKDGAEFDLSGVTVEQVNEGQGSFSVSGNTVTINAGSSQWPVVKISGAGMPAEGYTVEETAREGGSDSNIYVQYSLNSGTASDVCPSVRTDGDKLTIKNTEEGHKIGVRVTKKWVAADGVTDISSVVDREVVYFQLWQIQNGNKSQPEGYKDTYEIRREEDGSWGSVEFDELPTDPYNPITYYIKEVEKADGWNEWNPQWKAVESGVCVLLNGKEISAESPMRNDAKGVVTIVNTLESTGIQVVKKWNGQKGDPVRVQLLRTETSGSGSVDAGSTQPLYRESGENRIPVKVRISNKPLETWYIEKGTTLIFHQIPRDLWGSGQNEYCYLRAVGKRWHERDNYSEEINLINNNEGFSSYIPKDTEDDFPWTSVEIFMYAEKAVYEISFSGVSDTDTAAESEAADLPVGEPVELSDANGWFYEWTDLPAGKYSVQELDADKYVVEYENNEGISKGLITITNTRKWIDLSVTKIWKDAGDNSADWAGNIVLVLHKLPVSGSEETWSYTAGPSGSSASDGKDILIEPVNSDAPEVSIAGGRENGFTITFSGLDAGCSWYVTEERPEGYREAAYLRKVAETASGVRFSDADENGNKLTGARDGQYIINRPEEAFELPATGGPGTAHFYLAGMILFLFAGILTVQTHLKFQMFCAVFSRKTRV